MKASAKEWKREKPIKWKKKRWKQRKEERKWKKNKENGK